MKNKRIGHISKIFSKRHDIFAGNLTISFKNAKNPETFCNSKSKNSTNHLLEMMKM